jgi:formylglycine-generating enzyme required for sulfatase activity
VKAVSALCIFGMLTGLWSVPAPVFARDAAGQLLRSATDILNPAGDSSAVLEVREWEDGKVARESTYAAFFKGQDVLLLRKTLPEAERGRSILMRKNSMWIELPSTRRPLQLSREQRLTSEAMIADLARANFTRDYEIEAGGEQPHSGTLEHIALHAVSGDVPYTHAELWVEKQTGRPERALFAAAGRGLARLCEYGSYREVMGVKRPTQFLCSDPGRAHWKIELALKNWKETKLDGKFLDPGALGKEEAVVVRPKEDRAPKVEKPGSAENMALVPEGTFVMGRNNGFPDEQPAHEVFTAAFWIDRTEVTVGSYAQFLKAKRLAPPAPDSPSMPANYFTGRAFRDFPAAGVSWQSANAYCHWAGKRLPSEVEWEKAARGADQRLYPWGAVWDQDKANSRETRYSSVAGKNVHFTSVVGSFSDNSSPYGVLDMAGNVWEWVADWYAAYPGNSSPNDAYGRKYRVVRGGSWVSNSLALTTVARDYADPRFGYDSIGFRCAKDKDKR